LSRRLAALAAGALLLGACAAEGRNQVQGIVIEVVGDLTHVEQFTVRTDGGEMLTFVPSPDGDYPFPLSHLREHRATVSPIVVSFDESEAGVLVATAVDDADR
jgi:hypothetical protein